MSDNSFLSNGSLSDAINKTKNSLSGGGAANPFATPSNPFQPSGQEPPAPQPVAPPVPEPVAPPIQNEPIAPPVLEPITPPTPEPVEQEQVYVPPVQPEPVAPAPTFDPFATPSTPSVFNVTPAEAPVAPPTPVVEPPEEEVVNPVIDIPTAPTTIGEPVEAARKAFDLIKSMENWQLAIGKEGYFTFKDTMISIINELEKALNNEIIDHKSKCDKARISHEAALSDLRKRFLVMPEEAAKKECQDFIASLNASWTGPDGYKTKAEASISKYQFAFRDDSIVHSVISKVIASKDKPEIDAINQHIDAVRSQAVMVEARMKNAIDVAVRLRDAKIAFNKKAYEEAVDEENAKYNNKVELIDNEHKNNMANIINSVTPIFMQIFNRDNFSTLESVSLRSVKIASNYTFSTKIPQHLYLGKRVFRVKTQAENFLPEIKTLFSSINHEDVTVTNTHIRFVLPYVHSMQDGYSIFVESQSSDSQKAKDLVKTYATKILMNYPAGQTRPLFLDSNTQITCFTKIGDNSRRGLITKPWSKPEDIEAEVSKVAEERANLSVSYGDDVESRLRREPLYFVCARNFPMNFSTEAITHLANIFLSGAKNGFFGIIEADSKEISNRSGEKAVESALVTIKSNSLCLLENIPGTYIVNDGTKDQFFFDMAQLNDIDNPQVSSSIIKGFTDYSREIEKFDFLFSKDAGNVEGTRVDDMNTWFRASASSNYEVPIGIMGASTVQKYVVEGVAQHALVSGITGSGKSSLLRTIIIASMIKYTPDEVNFYLIDYKEGVEFAAFANYRLPWVKVIALETKRDFALNILRDLQKEFEKRAEEMRDSTTTRVDQLGHNRFPRIVLIFDEIQELLREQDKITDECVKILAKLVSEGRAMNMNVILASQNFSICKGMDQLKANMAIRIAFKGSPESVSSIMGSDFSYVQLEAGDSGYAAINSASGAKGSTNFFQVGYLDEGGRNELLGNLQMTMGSRACTTRVMSARVNQDRNNKFNRLISNSEVDYTETPDCYDLIIGDEFNLGSNKSISMSTKESENLIIVGEDESIAKSIFSLSMLSVLYDELASKAHKIDNELIRVIDLSDESDPHYEYFNFMKQEFPHQISVVDNFGCDRMIEDTYDNLMQRRSGEIDSSERLFFMLFGIDTKISLRQELFSDDDGELSLPQKLERILKEGPMYGINCIIWTHSYDSFKKIVSPNCAERYISKRMFFGENKDECDSLVGKKPADSVINNDAVMFRNVASTGISIFRPYAVPKKEWVMKFAETYKEFEESLSE